MYTQERFAIAAFRSRTSVQKFEMALRRIGIGCAIISTPREVAIGCGLSVRFDASKLSEAAQECKKINPVGFIGFYIVERTGGKLVVQPVHI